MFAYKIIRQLYLNSLYRGWVTPRPLMLNIFTTSRCNFSCSYCSRNSSNYSLIDLQSKTDDFNINDLKLLLARFPSIKIVSFVGVGEPFLVSNIIPMAQFCRKAGKKVKVITNGSLLHNYGDVVSNTFNSVSISLHGIDNEELVKIAGVKEEVFDQLTNNIHYLLDKGRQTNPAIEIRTSVVALKDNLKRVEKAAAFCYENKIPVLDIQNYLPSTPDETINCFYDDEEEYINFFINLCNKYKTKLIINAPIFVKRDKTKLKWNCPEVFSILRVNSSGFVSGCTKLFPPSAQNGNFKTDNNVWNNEYFRDIRSRFRNKSGIPELCRYCPCTQ